MQFLSNFFFLGGKLSDELEFYALHFQVHQSNFEIAFFIFSYRRYAVYEYKHEVVQLIYPIHQR